MFYVGIDIGKNTHVASVIDQEGTPCLHGFSFSNSLKGIQSLLNRLFQLADSPESFRIGLEATGHYWSSVYSYLDDHSFTQYVINPIQTDGWRKGTEIRRRKTDKIDSLLIAELIRHGEFVETLMTEEQLYSLKQYTRYRNYQRSQASDYKRKIIAVLDQIFPEYARVFKGNGLFSVTSLQLLQECPSPQEVDEWTTEDLTDFINRASRMRLGPERARKKATDLKEVSTESLGVTFGLESFIFQLHSMIEQLQFFESQIQETEKKIEELMNQLDSVITTITGIGPITGATILGELGDIRRFSSPKQIVAYAGLDPSVSQSGEFEATQNAMSKRGSPHLRKALFQAAIVACAHDPVLKAFYEKKRSEGKHHLTAVGAVARKMCHIIYAVLQKNEPYEIRK